MEKIILSILTSFGGGAVVAGIIIKFFCTHISNRIDKKYDVKLTKEVESFKAGLSKDIEAYKGNLNKEYASLTTTLGKKQYISEKKFDTQLEIFKELSTAFANMVRDISILVPTGLTYYPEDYQEKLKLQAEQYDRAHKSAVMAQDVLIAVIPFIPDELYVQYDNIRAKATIQLAAYEKRYDVGYMAPQSEKESYTKEDYAMTREINEDFKSLNEAVREYLDNLDVIPH